MVLRNIILPDLDVVIIMTANRAEAEAAFGEIWQQAASPMMSCGQRCVRAVHFPCAAECRTPHTAPTARCLDWEVSVASGLFRRHQSG
ncbi:hypothetical protein [Gemmatimonas sp.]|uniref:hypothetical protein n=1 Tax=Gemmatimonas sp. TaxID=1962908 RepID=UPI003F6EF529